MGSGRGARLLCSRTFHFLPLRGGLYLVLHCRWGPKAQVEAPVQRWLDSERGFGPWAAGALQHLFEAETFPTEGGGLRTRLSGCGPGRASALSCAPSPLPPQGPPSTQKQRSQDPRESCPICPPVLPPLSVTCLSPLALVTQVPTVWASAQWGRRSALSHARARHIPACSVPLQGSRRWVRGTRKPGPGPAVLPSA